MTFSVLMATYAKENPEYLDTCLASLEAQSLSPGEIVLVKDGSLTDDLEDVLLAHSVLPIRTIDYHGSGQLGGALALGIQNCSNEVIARMDSDDIARPNRFEIQVQAFRERKVTILGGQVEEFNDKPGDLLIRRQVPINVNAKNIGLRNPFNHMTVMFSRKAVLDAGNYLQLPGFEDWYLWLRMFERGAKFLNLDDVLVDTRVGNDFLGRRSGAKYALIERRAITRFYREGLIGAGTFLKSAVIRFPVRFLPKALTRMIYLRGLRKSG